VIYLATEMLLYMVAVALIGLALGWFVWGSGQRRKVDQLRDDLTAKLEAERSSHDELKDALDSAAANTRKAVEAARLDSRQSLAELHDALETERQRSSEAENALQKMRAEWDDMVRQGQEISQRAVDDALRAIDVEKAAAAEAIAKEAQSRAQIEELRLLVGAEKLTADTIRSELQTVRVDLQAALDTERAAHQTVKFALDDIRSTLAKTLGAEALSVPAPSESAVSSYAAPLNPLDERDQPASEEASPVGEDGDTGFSLIAEPMTAGDVAHAPILDEAESGQLDLVTGDLAPEDPTPEEMAREDLAPENRASSVDRDEEAPSEAVVDEIVPNMDPADLSGSADLIAPFATGDEEADVVSSTSLSTVDTDTDAIIEVFDPPIEVEPDPAAADFVDPIPASSDAVEPAPASSAQQDDTRPDVFRGPRPNHADDFQAIEGITADMESRLLDAGCYQYQQLAVLTPSELAWLAATIGVTPEQMVADHWVERAGDLWGEAEGEVRGDRDEVAEPADRRNATG